MCARVLPWSTQSNNSTLNNNSAISSSLPSASTTSAAAASASSIAPSSSSPGSPPSPSFAFPALPDSQASLSWLLPPSSASVSASAPGASLLSPPPGQPSTSTPISTTPSSQGGGGSTGTASSASLPFSGGNGVVVVGVIGRVEHEVSQFLDRLLDFHVFGAKNRAAEQWQESRELFVSASDLTGGSTRERKQRKDGHRSRSTEVQEDGVVLDGDASLMDNGGSAADDLGQKSGSRSGKGHVKNGHYGRRKEEVDAVSSSEKRHGGAEDSNARKEVQFESRSGKGGDEDSGKVREGWKEGQWSVPWLLSKFKYHHDLEKGMVYVQFTWGALPLDCLTEGPLRASVAKDGLFATLEHHEADGMRGLLFMFSVCHAIMIVQEGAGFDPHLLRVFRLLQTAKHSLAPFVKTQILPGLLPPPSSAVRPSPLKPLSVGTRPFVRSGVAGPNSSTVALMSGSTPVLIPGQCTPVVLFVYLEDMAEPTGGLSPHATTRAEELPDRYLPNYFPRQSPIGRPTSSGLGFLRTSKKSEPGLRKKLQASLEAQIRFLLKKCRTVTGFGDTTPLGSGVAPGMGPRGPGSSVNSFQGVGGGGALFVLDPSRAVILLDRMANSQTDALDAATDAIEAMFSDVDTFGFGKNISDRDGLEDILWDLGSNAATTGEDLQAVKDFLWRQAEILRGKGGISGNTGGGGTGGVGMVAAAAAAAAASAASGLGAGTNKPISNPPELPTFSSWLSACRVLADALSARLAEDSERDDSQKYSDVTHSGAKKRAVSPARTSGSMGKVVKTKPTIVPSLVCLEAGSHLDLKFSAAWCGRVLPSALDVYLKGLPSSYPTTLHRSQLEKALRVFHSMVRGQAVPLYAEKLKERCEGIWHSGRQLCDAESLTGKPCIHQVHDVVGTVSTHTSSDMAKDSSTGTSKGGSEKLVSKPHSSGVVFLHACACGRSRKLRKDPFDFESANVTFFKFPNCEEMLPSLIIPSSSENLPSGGSPWSLVRLGMSRYYQPEVGLVQSGFLPKQNFLSSWDIPIVYSTTEGQADTPVVSSKEDKSGLVSSKPYLDPKMTSKSLLRGTKPVLQAKSAGANPPGRVPEKGHVDSKNRTTSGNSDPKKGFTDTTTKANYGGESAFPPLPEKQDKPVIAVAKPVKQQGGKERKNRLLVVQDDEIATSALSTNDVGKKGQNKIGASLDGEGDHVSNVREVSGSSSDLSLHSVTKHARLYIGFEHECPRGHRFLLSDNQPEGLTYSSLKPGTGPSARHKKHDRIELRMKDSSSLTGSQYSDVTVQETLGNSAGPQIFPPKWTQKGPKIPDKMHYWSVQDGQGDGHSLLNSNLPIYMHCPYCKTSGEESNSNKRVTFGGTISQLQRVFLVTPSLPLQLASSPVVEFEDISKPAKRNLKFTPGSEIVLPPDSFLSLRLPFVYYSQVEGGAHRPLLVNQIQPERCAWLVKNTALYVLSKRGTIEPTMSGSFG